MAIYRSDKGAVTVKYPNGNVTGDCTRDEKSEGEVLDEEPHRYLVGRLFGAGTQRLSQKYILALSRKILFPSSPTFLFQEESKEFSGKPKQNFARQAKS